jgi:hypothetical protein
MKRDKARYIDISNLRYRYKILETVPRKATIIKGKNLSIKVAAVTCKIDLSLNAIALPKYSPTLKGVIIPAEKP